MHALIAPYITFLLTASCKSWITCKVQKHKQYSNVFALIVKCLHAYMMIKIMFFFTCIRILTENTICILRKSVFMPCYTCTCIYYMLIIPVEGIVVSSVLKVFFYIHACTLHHVTKWEKKINYFIFPYHRVLQKLVPLFWKNLPCLNQNQSCKYSLQFNLHCKWAYHQRFNHLLNFKKFEIFKFTLILSKLS